MAVTKMSLHRVIAEIKATEAKLALIQSTQFVGRAVKDAVDIEEFKKNSQASIDKIQSNLKNLATLKAARNKANAEVKVTVAGKQMTIDEALAAKAAVGYKATLVNTLQQQYTAAQNQIKAIDSQIEAKIEAQMTAMFGGTKKATEDELNLVRAAIEKKQKEEIVHADSLKTVVDTLKDEIEKFNTEVDFVLSEANATNTVEIELV